MSSEQNVVLIPGVLCDKAVWRSLPGQLSDIAKIHYASIPSEPDIQAMANNVLSTAPDKFWAVGFSLGGWVALKIAELKPEALQGLILISTSGGELLPGTKDAMRNAINTLGHDDFDNFIQASVPLYLTKKHTTDPELTKIFETMMRRIGPEVGSRQYQAILKLDKPFSHLADISCPVLIVRGNEDERHSLAVHKDLQRQIPGSKLVIIKDAAHFVPLEQPTVLSTTIEKFISEHQ